MLKLLSVLSILSYLLAGSAHAELVIYSARAEHLIKPLLKKYEKETGEQVKLVTGKAGALLERLKAEGSGSQADILLTVDAGNLWKAADLGLFERLDSKSLEKNVPAHLRDSEGRWYGLSVRARTIFYNKKLVDPSTLSTYEELGDKKWKKRLCLRTSKKVYNQSLVATMMSRIGADKTKKVLRAWVGNLAAPVFSSDTKVIEAIAAKQCDVGVGNTYYLGRLLKKNPDYPVAVFWPNQASSGVHVNISGAGILKNSSRKKQSLKLLEWLSSGEAQEWFASVNLEYPVNSAVKVNGLISKWGPFKQDQQNLAKAGENQAKAIMLMDEAGYK